MKWSEAVDFCKDVGGKLLEIDSTEEDEDVTTIVTAQYGPGHAWFWLGLTDAAREGDWRLASTGVVPQYLHCTLVQGLHLTIFYL